MNPDTGKFEELYTEDVDAMVAQLKEELVKASAGQILRADGSPVPEHWVTLRAGEAVEVKGLPFEVVYVGESTVVLEVRKRKIEEPLVK